MNTVSSNNMNPATNWIYANGQHHLSTWIHATYEVNVILNLRIAAAADLARDLCN